MRRVSVPVVTAVAGLSWALLVGAGSAAAGVPSAGAGGWAKAVEVPGTAALNAGGNAATESVSCVARGSCAAGGDYADGSGQFQAFVVAEVNGRWRKAIRVPGTAALNAGGVAGINSVSCAAKGSCAAGGGYKDGSGNRQAFVVTEVNGRWRKAVEVPGTAALNAGAFAATESVSCAAKASCAAGGFYTDGSGHLQAFVVTEVNGRWHKAIRVPGTPGLNAAGNADTVSVSCAAKGSCAATGDYTDVSGNRQAFVVTEVNGRWRKAILVPGTAGLNADGSAGAGWVSCAAKGSCALGGFYTDGSGHRQAFVVTEVNGRWRKAIRVPGTAGLNAGGNAQTLSVSCAAKGSCAAGGEYTDGSGHPQGFVVTEVNGRWRKAVEVPGTAALNAGGGAETATVSCAAAGSCAAGGDYTDGSGHHQAFVVTEVNGRWRKAIRVPGTPVLNAGGSAATFSVSCVAKGSCAAGGDYKDGSGQFQAFVVSKP